MDPKDTKHTLPMAADPSNQKEDENAEDKDVKNNDMKDTKSSLPVTPDPLIKSKDETLEQYLERIVPSKNLTPGTATDAKLQVDNPTPKETAPTPQLERYLSQASQYLYPETRDGYNSEREYDSEGESWKGKTLKSMLLDAASRCDVDSGSWVVPVPALFVDEFWKVLAERTWNGSLGTGVSLSRARQGSSEEFVAYVHHSKSYQYLQVEELADKIWKMSVMWKPGSVDTIYYRHDAFNLVGLRYGNEWGVTTSVWSSKYLKEGLRNRRNA